MHTHTNHKQSTVAVLALFLAFGFVFPSSARAATTPSLGAAGAYSIVSSTWTNSLNAGLETAITGGVCYTTLPDTPPISINGVTVTPLSQALVPCTAGIGSAQAAALADLNAQSCTSLGANVVLSGTYTPGCYSSTGTMDITLSTTVTLRGAGTYIFRSGGAFTTGANSVIALTNGASAADVFWTPGGAVILGANSSTSATPTFVGTIIADALGSTGITIGHFVNLLGRMLVYGHTVTTDSNTVIVPTTLRVIKSVVGGTAIPADFNVHVKSSGVDVAGSPSVGTSTPGTAYVLAAGTYVVSEDANASYTPVYGGDCNSSGSVTLAVGDDKTCTIINTANALVSVSSSSSGGGNGGYFAPLPLINLTKIPSPLALPRGSGSVTYTFVATNVGKVGMRGVWVKDDSCSPVVFSSGDSNNNNVLDINEEWTYHCNKIVSRTETNTATAHGNAGGWDGYDTANATVVVGVPLTPPLIHLVKKPSVFVLPAGGGTVTYSYTVTNPGTAPLSNVSVTDNKCTGLPGRVVGHPGDLNRNNLLERNEVWAFTCQSLLTQTTTNIGAAEGWANGLIAIDISPATVAVSAPGLPNTGINSDEKSISWATTLLAILFGVSMFFYSTRKKHAA